MMNEISATIVLEVGAEVRSAKGGDWKRITDLSPSFVQLDGAPPASRRLLEKMIADGRVEYREARVQWSAGDPASGNAAEAAWCTPVNAAEADREGAR